MAFDGFPLPNVVLQPDFTAIITGGHSGLGYELSKYLLFLGSRVIITCNDLIKGKAALLRLQADLMEMRQASSADQDIPSSASEILSASEVDSHQPQNLRLELMLLDTKSFASVNVFADRFKRTGYPLHLLVCNDGVACAPQEYTDDGHELHLQCNYLSHFLLITYLLPVMRRSAERRIPLDTIATGEHLELEDSRIILVANKAVDSGNLNLKNMQGKNQYNASKFYANSQFYLVMLMHMLVRRLKDEPISVFSVNNGQVDKTLKQQSDKPAAWGAVYSVGRSLGKILKNVTKNVSCSLKLCIVPQFKGLTGTYFVNGVPYTPNVMKLRDPVAQEALWGFSVQVLREYCSADDLASLQLTEEEFDLVTGVTK